MGSDESKAFLMGHCSGPYVLLVWSVLSAPVWYMVYTWHVLGCRRGVLAAFFLHAGAPDGGPTEELPGAKGNTSRGVPFGVHGRCVCVYRNILCIGIYTYIAKYIDR